MKQILPYLKWEMNPNTIRFDFSTSTLQINYPSKNWVNKAGNLITKGIKIT